jgi:DNA/RNA-binding domain of Phe-tRNA-synthetase-like protein
MTDPLTIRNLLTGRLSAGINTYRQLSLKPDRLLDLFISAQTTTIRLSHEAALPAGFTQSRLLYKSFHIDPTKHRPSSEALWRRLRDRNDFPRVNPLVDLTNLLSLKYQICYGLYDLDRVHGPVIITLGEAGDQYQGIRKEILNFQGKIVLRDEQGAFGNPSADSLRASVNETSREVLQVLFFHPGDVDRQSILAETHDTFKRFFTMTESRSCLI